MPQGWQRSSVTRTFYHKEPLVDVGVDALSPDLVESADFIISSEVFEHVAPPIARAFDNVYKMLKPRGLFVLTVPYGLQAATIEHFPDLYDFTLIDKPGPAPRLRNVTREGNVQEFDDVVMHLGDGSTLEMRVFAEADLVQHLTASGSKRFRSIEPLTFATVCGGQSRVHCQ